MLRDGIQRQLRQFDKGVSYRGSDLKGKLFDASNCLLVNGKIQTRNGLSRLTADAFATRPLSMSFYNNNSNSRALITKVSTAMYSVTTDKLVSSIKTGLTGTTKHDAVTMNGRHIIAIESDGLYSWDGTTFAALGVDAPTAPTIAAAAAGSLTDKTYTVAVTYYCSSTGFETNIGSSSNQQATNSGGGNSTLSVTSIPVSTHPLVTHKNVYLKNVTDSGNYLYVGQITNATTTYSITSNPSASSDTPPTGKDAPLAGGAKYLAIYNSQIVTAGNSTFPSDVFFSNADEPDGWSTDNTLIHAQGDGPITGIAVGYFSNGQLNQYLAVFKKRNITIFFQDLAGTAGLRDSQIIIDGVGCESHRSIKVKDGVIYFISSYGWRRIANGTLDKKTLSEGDIDDIFKQNGWTYGLNKQQLANSFAVYYGELDSYMCFVAEGASTSFDKCYNYHIDKDAFMPLIFSNSTCACRGEDGNGEETIYIGKSDGNIYTYNIRNDFKDDGTGGGFDLDIDQLDTDTLETSITSAIPVFVFFDWQPPEGPFDVTYNVRDMWLEAISDTTDAQSTITLKAYENFNRSSYNTYSYDFYTASGFTLDTSMLDVDTLSDDRSRSRIVADVNLTCRNILFGVYQSVEDAFLQLLAYQVNYSTNGNANI